MEDDEAEVRACQEEEEAILFPISTQGLAGWLGSGRNTMQYQQLPAVLPVALQICGMRCAREWLTTLQPVKRLVLLFLGCIMPPLGAG